MGAYNYLLISTISVSIFYLVYFVAFRQETNFKLIRFYLLGSILLSLVLPLNFFRIHVDFPKHVRPTENRTSVSTITSNASEAILNVNEEDIGAGNQSINWPEIGVRTYLFVSLILLLRIGWNLGYIFFRYYKSSKTKHDFCQLIYLKHGKYTYSFFNWIFICPEHSSEEEIEQIILHEKIHASQYHSIDIILVELLAAVMWFNPFVWMMRRTIKLVHEYLADEGALNAGINKLRYQTLLVNQVTEEKLICFSSNFNSSIIKKRIIMMNSGKSNRQNKSKIWILVPVTIALFLGVAIVNGQSNSNVETTQAKGRFIVVIDAGHGGTCTGAVSSNYLPEKEINLSIAKLLEAKSTSDIQIICTREADDFMSFEERVSKAKQAKADLFISLHVNASKDPQACGIEGLVPKESLHVHEAKVLLTELSKLNWSKTTIEPQKADYYVIKKASCPAVLLNIGYLTNKNDLSFVCEKKNQELICAKIMDAIEIIRTN